MGVPNNNKYSITTHTFKRFRERFDKYASNLEIQKKVASWLQEAEYLDETYSSHQKYKNLRDKKCELWYHAKDEAILVLDPKQLKVVTVMEPEEEELQNLVEETMNKEEYEVEEENTLDLETTFGEFVLELLSVREVSVKRQLLRGMSEELIEITERLDKLSRTARVDQFYLKESELRDKLEQVMPRLIEYQEIVSGFNKYLGE